MGNGGWGEVRISEKHPPVSFISLRGPILYNSTFYWRFREYLIAPKQNEIEKLQKTDKVRNPKKYLFRVSVNNSTLNPEGNE